MAISEADVSAGATTLGEITSADWSLQIGSIGEIVQGLNDIKQCIALILTTPKGSDPLRPTFGADLWRYIDNPINFAIPAIVREATAALGMWEPRVTILSVSATPALGLGSQAGAHLNVSITWRLRLDGASSASQVTTVGISGGV